MWCGAVWCGVVWGGVPVRTLVDLLGVLADGMLYLIETGGEKLPQAIEPKSVMVERSVPLAAMADALLAWEMNSVPISLAHVAAGRKGRPKSAVGLGNAGQVVDQFTGARVRCCLGRHGAGQGRRLWRHACGQIGRGVGR